MVILMALGARCVGLKCFWPGDAQYDMLICSTSGLK